MVYSAGPTPGNSDGECGDIFYAKSLFPWGHCCIQQRSQKRVNDRYYCNISRGYTSVHMTSKKIGKNSIIVVAWEDDRNSAEIGEPNLIYDIYLGTIDKAGNVSPNLSLSDSLYFQAPSPVKEILRYFSPSRIGWQQSRVCLLG